MDGQVHASRRTPDAPEGTLNLADAGNELLGQAKAMSSGRAAQTLTPGPGAPLKQTLLALKAGERLQEHVAPDATTLLGISGTVTLTYGGGSFELAQGVWAWCPSEPHEVEANTDAVFLLTVVNTADAS